jgi:hypothetical protein
MLFLKQAGDSGFDAVLDGWFRSLRSTGDFHPFEYAP